MSDSRTSSIPASEPRLSDAMSEPRLSDAMSEPRLSDATSNPQPELKHRPSASGPTGTTPRRASLPPLAKPPTPPVVPARRATIGGGISLDKTSPAKPSLPAPAPRPTSAQSTHRRESSTSSSLPPDDTPSHKSEEDDAFSAPLPPPPRSPPPLPPRRQAETSFRRSSFQLLAQAQSNLLRSIGRARVNTVESPPLALLEPGSRRSSARLSAADVDFILGRVNKISGETLRQAARDNNSSLAEALVRGSVNIDDQDVRGRTALMWAAKEGNTDTAIHLIDLGAALELKDEHGLTALAHAVDNGRLSTFRALVECGADVGVVDAAQRSLLTRALERFEKCANPQPGTDGRRAFVAQAEICVRLVQLAKDAPPRQGLQPITLFLLDEWVRARDAKEPPVVPSFGDFLSGEDALQTFFKAHRRRVNLMAAAKIYIVLLFVFFDLVMRQVEFTPVRLVAYVCLYLGAYYL